MIRFTGYFLVLGAMSAILSLYVAPAGWRLPEVIVLAVAMAILAAFPLAVLADFLFRRRPNGAWLPEGAHWPVRGVAFLSWVATGLAVLSAANWIPSGAPEWQQGPDTAEARRAIETMYWRAHSVSFSEVYYYETPQFTGSGPDYLRFDYANEQELHNLLPNLDSLPETPASACQGPSSNPPKWWLSSETAISSAYLSAVEDRVICIDRANRRAFVLRRGH